MVWAVAVSPLVMVLGLITGLRRPAHWAAAAGTLTAALLVWWLPDFSLSGAEVAAGAGAGGLLVLNAAAVMLPGVYLSQVLTRREVHRSLQEWVRQLPLSRPVKTALVVVGIGPTVESLTGFGVSLLVTVPVLLALAPPATALRQSLLGMNIMPWGTLGLATVVGGSLAGAGTAALGATTAVTSALVFPVLAVGAALLCRPARRLRAAGAAAALGAVLSLALIALNRLGVVEVAGVVAGLCTALLGVLAFAARRDRALLPPRPVLLAYGTVLGLVALIRVACALGLPDFTWQAGGASFHPLTSPGLPLLLTALILDRGRVHGTDARAALRRVARPLLALTGFVALGQVMARGGMIDALGTAVSGAHPLLLAPAVAALGMLGGFITGSNVGGNALLMQLQAGSAPDAHLELWFAALQNSAAGHAVFTSLPMIMLTLAVAGPAAKVSEHGLLRFGLRMASLVYAALAVVAVAGVLIL
ncbi:L-lactate permease [Streptomyces sp. MST-110588]|uniref:L-lactate permease n=1 Tax=Streptomyces sp. MST-110588 TaxID=2833628 RepID=UPI001F5C1B90|nr:L-lactate permease [Streptomyces sp. MST-110588]UNO40804.1 L-lactate permease [Streptomyces sp. MST-110588]